MCWQVRRLLSATAVIVLVLTLAACHSGGGRVTKFTVGGTVTNLNGTVVLQNNGGDDLTVSANGPFTFATAIKRGGSYAVTVKTQPAGQSCKVANGSGPVTEDVTNVGVACGSPKLWTWKGGSNLAAPKGVYGSIGVPALTNTPGGRNGPSSWTDPSGNFWVFGGQGYDSAGTAGVLNDLWQYSPTTGYWTWVKGSNTVGAKAVYGTVGVPGANNVPGARASAVAWTDASGNLWLFGGHGSDAVGTVGALGDLWKYSPSSGNWTWVAGPNTANSAGVYGLIGTPASASQPGARYMSVVWTDAAGSVWLFGGEGYDSAGTFGYLNDLWKYSPGIGKWTWVGGSKTIGASGVYGTQGTPGLANVPGARGAAVAWTDASGSFWLFSGLGVDSAGKASVLNDLWRLNPNNGQWTWVNGSNFVNAKGIYGTQGAAATGNVPGARAGSVAAADGSGNAWVFGGAGYDSVGAAANELNDLWLYNVTTGLWTWVSGSNLSMAKGVYGTLGTPSASTHPGARDSGSAWLDGYGNFWLFGGAGYDSAGAYDPVGLNDVFQYMP